MAMKVRASVINAQLNPLARKCHSFRFNFRGPLEERDDAADPVWRHAWGSNTAKQAEVEEVAAASGERKARQLSATVSRTRAICGEVTDAIVDALTRGSPPWRAPWTAGGGTALLPLRACGTPYRGINVVVLWRKAIAKGYSAPFWMTYRQAAARGGQVRKGERGTRVIKVGTVVRESEIPGEEPTTYGYLRSYRVFNLDQIDGLDERFRAPADRSTISGTGVDPALMAWFRRLDVGLETSGAPRAFYDVARDVIHMPPEDFFKDGATYAGVLLHETIHATGAPHRLDRRLSDAFSDTRYAHEELVAELGSAMAGALLGIEPRFEENAAYLKEWIKILKSDHRAILKTASAAQAACDWLMAQAGDLAGSPAGRQPPIEPD
ncbi:MAG: DUF1738 domain-containing protein [Boseongicola sp. SB0675_bin_26]|nr:DUF1738 domain-containing protein [Boseongicola sp. SB0675_bin_26]